MTRKSTEGYFSVSVVTAAFNCAEYIRENIASVATQTRPVLEHIIVDDGSTDGTDEALAKSAGEHKHMRVIRQPNKGAGAARNAGIEAAQGSVIAFLDADDLWKPDKVRKQVAHMELTGSHFSYGDYLTIDAEDGRIRQSYGLPDRLEYRDFLFGCPVGCLAVAYDQRYYGKMYMPRMRRGQDWGLWLSLTRDGDVATKYPGLEALYRYRKGSLSKAKVQKAMDVYRIYREQEALGRVRSLYFLSNHICSTLVKSRRYGAKMRTRR